MRREALCHATGSVRRRCGELRTEVLIQEQRRLLPVPREVEHVHDAARRRVERTAAEALTAEPVVFDELAPRTPG